RDRFGLSSGGIAQIQARTVTRLVGGEYDRLTVRQEVGGEHIEAVVRQCPRLADAGGEQQDLRRRRVRDGGRPGAIRRERLRRALAEANGWRTVESTQVRRVCRTSTLSGFGNEDLAAVGTDVRDEGVVQPGQLAFLLVAGPAAQDSEAVALVGHQNAS